MPTAIEAQIKNHVASFVAELDQLVRRSTLESLRDVLEGAGRPRRGRPAGGGRGPGRPRGSGAVAGDGVAESIVAHVRANAGQTVGEIVKALGAAPAAAKKAIAGLLASGTLKKTGQRRGTRYHIGSGKPARGRAGARRGRRKG